MRPCKCGNPELTVTTKGFMYEISCEQCGYSTGEQEGFVTAAKIWNERNNGAKVAKKYLRRARGKRS